MDLICGDYRNGMTTDPENIVAAVRAGHMSEATVDRALRRLFEARIRLGLFDPQPAFPDITARDYDTPAHHAKSREMSEASMVLLKNDGNLLPFKSAPRTIAVIGPNADSFDALVGNYYGTPSKPVTVLDGIRARYPNARILHAEGTGLIGPAETPVPDSAFRGLRVQHFGNRDLQGSPVSAAPAKNARIDWTGDRESSARWTGTLTAPETGVSLPLRQRERLSRLDRQPADRRRVGRRRCALDPVGLGSPEARQELRSACRGIPARRPWRAAASLEPAER
jgi:beta-glucosidase